MTARRILLPDMPLEDWLAARQHGLGGSEVAAVVGLSPWESRWSLWHRKSGLLGPVEQSDEMRWGTILEPVIAGHMTGLHPELAVRQVGTWCHVDRPWQIANPDRVLFRRERGNLPGRMVWEGKTAHDPDGWGEPGTDEIPVYYRCQVQWYMDTLGIDTTILSVLIAGSDYREYIIGYDPDDAAFLRAAGEAFVDTVKRGERPDLDEHSATYRAVRELHPEIDGQDVDVPYGVGVEWLRAQRYAELSAESLQLAKVELLDAMGPARRALLAGEPIARRQPARGGTVALYQIKPKAKPGQKIVEAAA